MQIAFYRAYKTLCVRISFGYYDAWGNMIVTYHNGGTSAGVGKNPFRYRGYYYDVDLKMYYLQSRYYDERIARFINADNTYVLTSTPFALTDKNLYAYCDNDPVSRTDENGEFWGIVAITMIVVGIALVVHDIIVISHLDDRSIDDSLRINFNEDGGVITSVQIENSNKLWTSLMQLGFACYINYFREDTKDFFKGSAQGIANEGGWTHIYNLRLRIQKYRRICFHSL